MTLLENSSWFNHIQMSEKLDYSLTNSHLPSSKNGQDKDFLGASIPPAAAQQVKHVMGWSIGSKAMALAVVKGCVAAAQLVVSTGPWFAPLQPAETGAQLVAPVWALLVCWSGIPHLLVTICSGNGRKPHSPPSPFPSPLLGRAADKLTDREGNA